MNAEIKLGLLSGYMDKPDPKDATPRKHAGIGTNSLRNCAEGSQEKIRNVTFEKIVLSQHL